MRALGVRVLGCEAFFGPTGLSAERWLVSEDGEGERPNLFLLTALKCEGGAGGVS